MTSDDIAMFLLSLVFYIQVLINANRASGISLGESVMVKWYALTSMHWKY